MGHILGDTTLSVMTLSITTPSIIAQYSYAECNVSVMLSVIYAECRYALMALLTEMC